MGKSFIIFLAHETFGREGVKDLTKFTDSIASSTPVHYPVIFHTYSPPAAHK